MHDNGNYCVAQSLFYNKKYLQIAFTVRLSNQFLSKVTVLGNKYKLITLHTLLNFSTQTICTAFIPMLFIYFVLPPTCTDVNYMKCIRHVWCKYIVAYAMLCSAVLLLLFADKSHHRLKNLRSSWTAMDIYKKRYMFINSISMTCCMIFYWKITKVQNKSWNSGSVINTVLTQKFTVESTNVV